MSPPPLLPLFQRLPTHSPSCFLPQGSHFPIKHWPSPEQPTPLLPMPAPHGGTACLPHLCPLPWWPLWAPDSATRGLYPAEISASEHNFQVQTQKGQVIKSVISSGGIWVERLGNRLHKPPAPLQPQMWLWHFTLYGKGCHSDLLQAFQNTQGHCSKDTLCTEIRRHRLPGCIIALPIYKWCFPWLFQIHTLTNTFSIQISGTFHLAKCYPVCSNLATTKRYTRTEDCEEQHLKSGKV